MWPSVSYVYYATLHLGGCTRSVHIAVLHHQASVCRLVRPTPAIADSGRCWHAVSSAALSSCGYVSLRLKIIHEATTPCPDAFARLRRMYECVFLRYRHSDSSITQISAARRQSELLTALRRSLCWRWFAVIATTLISVPLPSWSQISSSVCRHFPKRK